MSRMQKADPPSSYELMTLMADGTPVTLWPQYTSREDIKGAEDSKWIMMKADDKWWEHIVQAERAAALKDFPLIKWKKMDIRSREISAKSMQILSQKIVKGIHYARETHRRQDTPYIGQGEETEIDETSDSDSSSDARRNHAICGPRNKKKTFKSTPIVTVCLEGHRISVLNCLKPVAIRVGMNTHRWLSLCAPIVIQETCEQMCKDEADELEASTPPKEHAPYCFKPVECPPIAGKVAWVSDKYTWVVLSNPGKAKPAAATDAGESPRTSFDAPAAKRQYFSVDPFLPIAEYNREKFLAYRRAICDWNENDKTKRRRIQTDYDSLPCESDVCCENLPEKPDQAGATEERAWDWDKCRDDLPESLLEANVTVEADAM